MRPVGKEIQLSNTQRRILRELQINAKVTMLELGETVGLSQSAVTAQIKSLVKLGCIRRFTVELDPRSIGLRLLGYVHVRLKTHANQTSDEFMKVIGRSFPSIVKLVQVTGYWDFAAECLAHDPEELDRIGSELCDLSEVDRVETQTALGIPLIQPIPV